MMIDDFVMENELFIARKDAHKMKVKDMDPKMEYFPCEDNEGQCVIIKGYKYCITKKCNNKIEICVNEDVAPKFWEHDYISAKLWFESYSTAVEKHKMCTKVYKDVDPNQLMSILFFFDLDASKYDNLKDVIDAADQVMQEIEEETVNIAKRSLIKFFNE